MEVKGGSCGSVPGPQAEQPAQQTIRLLLLDRDRQNGVDRGNSPPPTYRSYTGSLLRAPLTTTLRANGAAGSIAGTSEYSLPPSYRSRNTNPATICSERSVGTTPTDHLLRNEDIPEPSSSEQLPNSHSDSTLRSLPERPIRSNSVTLAKDFQHVRNPRPSHCRGTPPCTTNKQEESRANTTTEVNAHSQKELVTVVTISKNDSQVDADNAHNGEHIEILAHL
ncbi:uncharacterized protein LOC118752305 [Rhagoletis pomonella]|uniref:uncharacterized protein LOC118752303 n=1 Tax=Rhagoletis pomonella TaxID=28610 RepID=UPI00177E7B60|nr:uncharacterized protein LOC118752303 [Rhagoletis pomonella]XP_036343067.1 uncharacterized protein LOC118752305 [Rhagoletis pomonella]